MPVDLVRSVIARWSEPDPKHVSLLREAGIEAVMLEKPAAAFSDACRVAGIQTVLPEGFDWVDAKTVGSAPRNKPAVLKEGAWPGVARDPGVAGRGDETASASRDPWIEINGYWVPYLRALFRKEPAVLGYTAELGDRGVPYDSLELAMVEARSFGGNYILTVEPMYRAALLRGDEKALAAWRQLGRTARWLREQEPLLGQPVFPAVTLLVEPGEETPEIAKLMFRRNVSPALESAAQVPPPEPGRRLVVAAVDLKALPVDGRKRIMAHAESGARAVVNGPGWPIAQLKHLRKEEDRDFYAAGKGELVVYRDTIADPSEFAMDVIDLLTHARRPVRLWNAPTVVAVASGKSLMHCINYGSPIGSPVQVRMQGSYTRATLLRPDGAPVELKGARRGSTTEVFVPELRRLGILVFR